MEREEFKVLVKGMKAVYAQATFIPDQDAFNIWYELLKDIPYSQANVAVQKYMLTEKFPPTIADIRAKAVEIVESRDSSMSELEAWALVRKAIGNSGYHAEEEFEKLPEACKRAVGTPQNLREWAVMDSDAVATVEQSHFIKSYRVVVKRLEEDKKIPDGIKRLIREVKEEHEAIVQKPTAQLRTSVDDKGETEQNTDSEYGMSETTKKRLDEVLRGLGG